MICTARAAASSCPRASTGTTPPGSPRSGPHSPASPSPRRSGAASPALPPATTAASAHGPPRSGPTADESRSRPGCTPRPHPWRCVPEQHPGQRRAIDIGSELHQRAKIADAHERRPVAHGPSQVYLQTVDPDRPMVMHATLRTPGLVSASAAGSTPRQPFGHGAEPLDRVRRMIARPFPSMLPSARRSPARGGRPRLRALSAGPSAPARAAAPSLPCRPSPSARQRQTHDRRRHRPSHGVSSRGPYAASAVGFSLLVGVPAPPACPSHAPRRRPRKPDPREDIPDACVHRPPRAPARISTTSTPSAALPPRGSPAPARPRASIRHDPPCWPRGPSGSRARRIAIGPSRRLPTHPVHPREPPVVGQVHDHLGRAHPPSPPNTSDRQSGRNPRPRSRSASRAARRARPQA